MGFIFAKIAAKKVAEDADIAVAYKNSRVKKRRNYLIMKMSTNLY
jgi:hypothetical protein